MAQLPKRGSKLLCTDAKDPGITITEGSTYTTASSFRKYPGDAEVNEDEPGVTLVEVEGYFMLKRFKEIPDG